MSSSKKIQVAVVGNGLASVCLVKGLCTNPRFDVQIFEASDGTWYGGQAFGLGANAQRALQMISPDLRKALDDSGGTEMERTVKMMMGTGPNQGELINYVQSNSLQQIVVSRGGFQREINKTIPDVRVSTHQRVTNIQVGSEAGTKALVTFEDRTIRSFDAVIGGDGINSIVRSAVLGPHHPALRPIFAGGYSIRIIVPLTQAIEAFGPEYCEETTQCGWVGQGGFLLTDKLNDGKSMQVIAGQRGNKRTGESAWPYGDEAWHEWPKERLEKDLSDWGDVGKAIAKLFSDQSQLHAMGGRVHLMTPTYSNGNVCIIGDAAGAFAPFHGAGAGQAIEDALLLSTLLNEVKDVGQIQKAFKVYDEVRRPRRTLIAKESDEAGDLLCGYSEVGLDIERLRVALEGWQDFITEYDLKAMVEAGRMGLLSAS